MMSTKTRQEMRLTIVEEVEGECDRCRRKLTIDRSSDNRPTLLPGWRSVALTFGQDTLLCPFCASSLDEWFAKA